MNTVTTLKIVNESMVPDGIWSSGNADIFSKYEIVEISFIMRNENIKKSLEI